MKLPKDEKRGRKAYHLGLRNDEVKILGDRLQLVDFLSGAEIPDVLFGELKLLNPIADSRTME